VTSLSADLTAPAPEPDQAGALALVLAAFGLPAEVEPLRAVAVETPELTRSDVVRLLAAWRGWAGAPGSERAADVLEGACRVVATKRGTSATAVRLWILGSLAPLGLDAEGATR
jgi:hypothetical protein